MKISSTPQPERHNKLRGSKSMDRNELSGIHINCDGEWFEAVYKNLIKSYRKSVEKWLSGTDGGSGKPENYHN